MISWKIPRLALPALLLAGSNLAFGGDQPQWGQRHSRNMVSDQVGLPARFDPETGENVQWSVPLGTACYSTPVVAAGRVLVGTNNHPPRDPRHQGDRGVMLCLDESDGSLRWQLVVPKLEGDIYLDWPRAGMCSPATVAGDRAYTVTNRNEVVALDLEGLANGNQGPFLEEARHMTPQGEAEMELGETDADIVWLLDLRAEAGVRPHDASHSSILKDGPYLYVNTSNGLTSRHDGVERPEAPALVVVDRATGRLIAEEREGISERIFHCAWSSPALGEVNGRRLIFFGGPDGVVYAFEALEHDERAERAAGPVQALQRVWKFDCDPDAPKEDIHSYIRNRREGPSSIKSMPVFHADRVYVTVGGDIWWGKQQSWLQCIDATGSGDVTEDGLVWSYPLERHSCSTPAVHDGLVYAADTAGNIHCVDARDGRRVWVHPTRDQIWASPLVADGKLYIGTRRGNFWILAAGRELKVLHQIRMDSPVYSSAVAANGTLFVATMERLYALQQTGR